MSFLFALLIAAALGNTPIPPTPTAYVTDPARVLDPATTASVNAELREYEQKTRHHIIVWIGQTTGDAALEDWTIRAAEKWKIGRKNADDGAILFAFMQDHRIRIEVGYGLEPVLTDARSAQIIARDMTPLMRRGDVDGAIRAGVDRMLLTITPDYAIGHAVTPEQTRSSESGNTNGGDVFFWVLFVALGLIVPLIRYVYVYARQGPRAAGQSWNRWYATGAGIGWSLGGFGGGGGSGGGGFSGGFGGGFGGGGASGGW